MLKVLIVEDMKYIRKGLITTTPWADFDCIVAGEAENGAEALELIERLHPDIVITDIRMEEMDGLELIRAARKISDCEFVIISGYDDFQYAQQAVKLGVQGYLLKPVEDDSLREVMLDTVEEVHRKRQYHQLLHQASGQKVGQLGFGEDLVRMSFKNKYLDSAMTILKDRCNEDLTVKSVAEELHISTSYLARLFKDRTDYTFLDVLTLFRVRKAMELLETDELKMYEIAAEVGYRAPRYFSDVFRKVVGVTPSEYRAGKIPSEETI